MNNLCFNDKDNYLLSLLPQWFVLPAIGETHCCGINGWIIGKKRIYLGFHVVIGRNDVQEILDDAKVKVNTERICGQSYPIAHHAIRNHGADSVLLVPHTGMVATGITSQGYDGEP